MKAACVMLTVLICVAIMAVCVMVKFAADVAVEHALPGAAAPLASTSLTVLALSGNDSVSVARRFPYVAAIAINSTDSWSFACFAGVVLVEWLVTSARCRARGAAHRALLLGDFARNLTRTYPVSYWKIHEKFNINDSTSMFDIAVAKFSADEPLALAPAVLDDRAVAWGEACVWRTVSSVDRKVYLTNDVASLEARVAPLGRCGASDGGAHGSMLCVDVSGSDDCFVHEFGPIFHGNKLVGILSAKPGGCDVKFAVFTNVSYFATWIRKSVRATSSAHHR